MADKKRSLGLGKGLDALFGENSIDALETAAEEGAVTAEIRIDDIKPNANQPRKTFTEESLGELTESIKEHGLIQPIVVRSAGEGYEIVAGERRWRASRAAGLKTVPCLVRDLSDEETMLFAIIENMQRQDLDPIEEAEGLDKMIKQYGMTQEQVSRSVSKSRPYITNSLRLLKLPDEIRAMMRNGELTGGHGRAILSLKSEKEQKALAEKIVKEGLSVRATEALAAGDKKKAPAKGRPANKNADVLQVESDLKEALGTKVNLVMGANKGKIEIEYFSRDELERLIELLRGLR